MNNIFKIGFVQERWYPDPKKHIARLTAGIVDAAKRGAKIICLQELTLNRYFASKNDRDPAQYWETIPNGATCKFASDVAVQSGIHVIASLFEKPASGNGLGYNVAVCFGPDGKLKAMTRKQHIPQGEGYYEDHYFAPGDSDYPVHQIANHKIAMPTCYDQWFPELSRIYGKKGAEIIFFPTAIGSEPTAPHFDSQPIWQRVITANGIMAHTFMCAVNRVGEEDNMQFYGSSFISDPTGKILVQAPRNEPATLVAELDFDVRSEWMQLFPFFDQRQPQTYTTLTE
ncbi:MAG TPA: nitrilase-related carbon-nitrogen hydrolase [Anaerolineales bacterium]|nr:nitrilase-related carbon-nitrogen hydrolase [Anaerolineales bacterium]